MRGELKLRLQLEANKNHHERLPEASLTPSIQLLFPIQRFQEH